MRISDWSSDVCSSDLADAVAEVGDGVEPGQILLLQEIDGIGFALRKQRDEDVGTRYLVLARRLDVQDRALDDALETAGGAGVAVPLDLQAVGFGELGRESGRGRVCRSVYISVVAVSLKKKKEYQEQNITRK